MRILLIEDDKALGSDVREHVAADGHAVDWAMTLSTAQDYAAGAVAAYELVLLELNLPDGNDIDYLREMRKRQDATPVIILTARDQISDRIEGLNAGSDDYLSSRSISANSPRASMPWRVATGSARAL